MMRLWVANFALIGCYCLVPSSLSAQATAERDVSQIRIEGLESIPIDVVLRKLANLPEIFEASHHSIDDATFVHRVREAIARGLLNSGWLDSQVTVTETDPLTLQVVEGPRFRYGSVTVEGATEDVNDWIQTQLMTAASGKEDAKPVWKRGKPVVGTLFGSLHRSQAIQERLRGLGLKAENVHIELVRDDERREHDLKVQLAKQDAFFHIRVSNEADVSERVETEAVAVTQTEEATIPNSGTANTLRDELQNIHQRMFAEPSPGIRFEGNGDELEFELWFGKQVVVARLDYQSHHRDIVLVDGELLISMPEPAAAIRIPIPNASAVMYQQSTEESENGQTMGLTLNGEFTSKEPDEPMRMGVRFTAAGWAEWFPPESTERIEDQNGVRYSYGDHQLALDTDGRLIELKGTDGEGRKLRVTPAAEQEILNLADRISSVAQPIEFFVRDRDTNQRVALRDVVQDLPGSDPDNSEFFIPPAGGQRDLFGVLVLTFVNGEQLVDSDSLIGRLSKLYSLELSRNRRGLAERIAEIDDEALQGPFATAVVADLLSRQGQFNLALDRYRLSQLLADDSQAVQRDIQHILAPSNLFGRVCAQVDVKQWLDQSARLAAPFVDQVPISVVRGVVETMPDAIDEQQRLENARRLLGVAYELLGRSILQENVRVRIDTIEKYQQRVAEKKAKKDKEKKKKR